MNIIPIIRYYLYRLTTCKKVVKVESDFSKRPWLHEPILGASVKKTTMDGVALYVCHFAKNRIYYSPMRQFIDCTEDYKDVTSRFIAFSEIGRENDIVKVVFPEDFPNSIKKNGRIHQCVELNDGGLLVEVENGEEIGNGCFVRQLYKIKGFTSMSPDDGMIPVKQCQIVRKLTYVNPTKVVPSTVANSRGKEFSSSFTSGVKLLQCWGLSIFENITILAGYDTGGRNACVYFSDDNFDTVKLIFNGASDDIKVDVPDAKRGRWPQTGGIIPADSFSWNETGNGNVHVHGVAYDPYYDRIWVTTGDGASLKRRVTGVFYSDDIGKTWRFVNLSGICSIRKGITQLLSIIPLKDCVLFTTDGNGDGIFSYKRKSKDEKVKLEYVYSYVGEQTSLNTIAAGSFITSRGGIILFPYGRLTENILKKTHCGVVFTPDGLTYQLLYQEPDPVGEVSKSVIHRRSIIREYKNMILVSTYNGGYLELEFK